MWVVSSEGGSGKNSPADILKASCVFELVCYRVFSCVVMSKEDFNNICELKHFCKVLIVQT